MCFPCAGKPCGGVVSAERKGPAALAGAHRAGYEVTQLRNHSRIADELQAIARNVRRIGDGYRTNPETIALQKDEAAHRLTRLARSLGRGRHD